MLYWCVAMGLRLRVDSGTQTISIDRYLMHLSAVVRTGGSAGISICGIAVRSSKIEANRNVLSTGCIGVLMQTSRVPRKRAPNVANYRSQVREFGSPTCPRRLAH